MRMKILLAGTDGAPTEGVVYSLQLNPKNNVIGMGSEPIDLILSRVNQKYYVPYANTANYKDRLLNILGIVFSKEDWMMGDTGYDINTGKRIGTNTCAVLSGFMSEQSLGNYSPDLKIENVTYLDICFFYQGINSTLIGSY
jgi:hypothetical protein